MFVMQIHFQVNLKFDYAFLISCQNTGIISPSLIRIETREWSPCIKQFRKMKDERGSEQEIEIDFWICEGVTSR